jgi:hypothetical protein
MWGYWYSQITYNKGHIMNRNRIIAVIAGVLALIGVAVVPAIQAAWLGQEAAPATLAPPRASGYSGPVDSWSAYQPIEGLPPAAAQPAAAPVSLAPPRASSYSGPLNSWSAYQPIEGLPPTAAPVNLAPPQASSYSGPVNSWSAYQPIEGLPPTAAPGGGQ